MANDGLHHTPHLLRIRTLGHVETMAKSRAVLLNDARDCCRTVVLHAPILFWHLGVGQTAGKTYRRLRSYGASCPRVDPCQQLSLLNATAQIIDAIKASVCSHSARTSTGGLTGFFVRHVQKEGELSAPNSLINTSHAINHT